MPSPIPEDVASQLSTQVIIVVPIINLSVMYFVYGFYVLLFSTCVYMMRSHQRGGARLNWSLYLSLTVALFVFSTAFVVVYTIDMVYGSIVFFTAVKTQDYEVLVDFWMRAELAVVPTLRLLFGILLNITAECMLIHRCYLIWGSKKRVAIPLIVASVLINAVGLASTIIEIIEDSDTDFDSGSAFKLYDIGQNIGFVYQIALSPAINSVITLLTAGRIWWIHRQVKAHNVHTTSDKLIQSVSAIILESGSLYPVSSIVGLVVRNTTTIPLDFFPLTALSAGIAPTLIMVRAKLGKNVESLQDEVSGIRFASRPVPWEETTTVSRAPVHSIGNLSMAAAELEGGNEGWVANRRKKRPHCNQTCTNNLGILVVSRPIGYLVTAWQGQSYICYVKWNTTSMGNSL